MPDLGSRFRNACSICLYLDIALTLTLALCVHAQVNSPVTPPPVNPPGLTPVVNYPRPIQYGGGGGSGDNPGGATTPTCLWSFTISPTYLFLDDRSRVGGISLTSQSGGIDFTIDDDNAPLFTSFDVGYIYSNGSGSSVAASSETVNQHIASLRVLQPFDQFLWSKNRNWKPITLLDTSRPHFQSAVVLGVAYGGSWGTINTPHFTSTQTSARTLLGNALYDFQWLQFRNGDINGLGGAYPNFLFEYSSGIQISAIRYHSSERALSTTSYGSQVTYRNVASFTYSFLCRWGLLVAAEWDAPIESDPLHGSQPYHANTATFTAGIVYNLYPKKYTTISDLLNRCSLSLLYSYTAFDPLTETNGLQVQVSYSF